MKGTVKIFNATKGLGFIRGEDGREYFAHYSQIRRVGGGIEFKMLLPGWEVEFDPREIEFDPANGKKGPVAQRVRALNPSGTEIDPTVPKPQLANGVTNIRITDEGGIVIDDVTLKPRVTAKGLNVYYLGFGAVKGFNLTIPAPTKEGMFLLLDRDKNPRRPRPDWKYENIQPGSYLLHVSANGGVTVTNIGRRQDFVSVEGGENWIVLEERFSHKYDFADPTAGNLRAQTPTSGKARDNDGFVPGVLNALQLMRGTS